MPSDDALYDELMDAYMHAEKRVIPGAVEGHATNPSCGDACTVYLLIVDGVIRDASFTGDGCAVSTAYTSRLVEQLRGMRVEEAETLRENDVLMLFGTPDAPRLKCALLGFHAMRDALRGVKHGGLRDENDG